MNPSHQIVGLDSVSLRIKAGIGNILELDPTPTTIPPFEEADLTGAERALSIVEDSNQELSLLAAHAPSPIRSE